MYMCWMHRFPVNHKLKHLCSQNYNISPWSKEKFLSHASLQQNTSLFIYQLAFMCPAVKQISQPRLGKVRVVVQIPGDLFETAWAVSPENPICLEVLNVPRNPRTEATFGWQSATVAKLYTSCTQAILREALHFLGHVDLSLMYPIKGQLVQKPEHLTPRLWHEKDKYLEVHWAKLLWTLNRLCLPVDSFFHCSLSATVLLVWEGKSGFRMSGES